MSGMYYPESWMQHPEVLRLQQRVRDLERKLKSEDELIDIAKKEIDKSSSYLAGKIREAATCEAKLKAAEDKIQDYKEKMEAFNNSSLFAKMFYHFNIDQ